MKVLVACEFSGIVREAFRARGHDAWSCDLLPTEIPGQHIQGDIFNLDGGHGCQWSSFKLPFYFDMMIAFPPCTHLAVSGARWFKYKEQEQQEAIDFFMRLVEMPIRYIAVENPIGIMSRLYRKPDQIIQPWQFGHCESKATCLWLKNLPKLRSTHIIEPQTYGCACGYKFNVSLGKYGCPNCNGDKGAAKLIFDNQTPTGQNKLGPSLTRAQDRSRTYQGIANAMAEQWGGIA